MADIAPLSNVAASHNPSTGRFAKGNKAAKGRSNAMAARVHRLRAALIAAVSEEDIQRIVLCLLEQVDKGNIAACKEILDRVIGKPLEADVLEKIAELEARLAEVAADRAAGAPNPRQFQINKGHLALHG